MTLVDNKLIEEDEKQKRRQSYEDTVLKTTHKPRQNVNSSKKVISHFCHDVGHIRQKYKSEKSNDNNQNAKIAESDGDRDNFCFVLNAKACIWVIDSAATCHISSVKEEFINLDLTWCKKVTVANGNVVYSAGIGSCKIKFLNDNGAQTFIRVENVLYIPSFKGNLLSVKRLSAADFKILFYGSICEILDINNDKLASRNVLTKW